MWKHKSSNAAAASEEEKLPPGWVKKESKSQKGRYYYISPSGKTQWTPPIVKREKVQRQYNWVNEIEIEFGEGRLGVSLREVKQMESIPYTQFQAEVDDLPKVNGKAGPAEIYNWGVKPHKRLTIGMRVTSIDGTPLAGYTYKEVVDKLKKAPRPVKIKFADADKGTIEDNPNAVLEEQQAPAETKPSAYFVQKQEYTRLLVTSELHTEMWSIENKKLARKMKKIRKKWATVSSELEAMTVHRDELRKEHDTLLEDKQKYDGMIKQLKLQESHAVGNPEFIEANNLAKKHTQLTEHIATLGSGNKTLRSDRVALQAKLDKLESALSELGKSEEEDKADDDLFFGIDPNASPSEQLAALRKKMRFMEDELIKEQRKASKAEKEMDQLNRHLAKLTGSTHTSSSASTTSGSTSASSTSVSTPTRSRQEGNSRTGDAEASSRSEKSSEEVTLEARIHDLRKKLRSVVEAMSKAAQADDTSLTRDYEKKRKAIKDELRRAQDALITLRAGGKGDASSPSSPPLKPSSSSSGRPPKVISAQELQSKNKSSEQKMPTLSGLLDKGPTEWSERGLIRNMKTMRGARERWCEITPQGVLRYYKRRGDPVVRGEIDLSDSSFEVVCEDMQRGKDFVLCTSSQQSHFFAKTTQDMQLWVKTLRAANAYLVAHKQVDSIASKLDAAERRNGDMPEDEEQFYGRATLGF